MRKFTVTTFAICYAALLVFVSVDRTSEWAHKEGDNLSYFHQIAHSSKGIGKGGKTDSHLLPTRLVETGFCRQRCLQKLRLHRFRRNGLSIVRSRIFMFQQLPHCFVPVLLLP